ncbi:MAG: hypothetical protein RIG62_03700 [Cyclobacteriaceae bacterium]
MLAQFTILHRVSLIVLLFPMFIGCRTTPPISAPGVPAFANREAYREARQQYVSQDSLLSFDADIVLSEKEQRANRKLLSLQQQMLNHYKDTNFFPPARYFYQSKEHIEQTDLYHLLRKMPKGGLLHLHPSASGDLHWVVDRALTEPHCHVYWSTSSPSYVKGQLAFFEEGDAPGGFKPVKEVARQTPHFTDSLYDLLTFDAGMSADSVDVWAAFETHFQQVNKFFYYQPVFRDYLTAVFDTLIADGVQHVELRSFMGNVMYDLSHEPGYYTADTLVSYYQQAMQRAQEADPNFTIKLIQTNLRFRPLETIQQDVMHAFRMRKRYPDLIKAYDLVAEEDAGHSTLYFLDAWLMFDSLQQEYDIDLPLCLHDGESDWASVDNLYDAVTLNSRRIGHGFNLYRFPALQQAIKAQDICIEVSPLSNQILGYVRDLRVHPASGYLTQGIQCSISADDPGVFGYNGVTYDYWSIFLAWELDLQALKKLALNSINYSLLSDAEKETARQVWQRRWDTFIDECIAYEP